MSATDSHRSRPPRDLGTAPEWALAVVCLALLALMVRFIQSTTVPYHLIFLSVALTYGFRVWPLGRTSIAIGALTVATGTVFVHAYLLGLIAVDELSEVALMPLLLLALVWHAWRREMAVREAQRVAEMNAELRRREHENLRDTSHALRGPTAIAQGFVELMMMQTADPELIEPLTIVSRQLARTTTLSERLLSLAALDAHGISSVDMVDVSALVRQAGAEWPERGRRDWQVDVRPNLWVLGDRTALETALDALLENALNHTSTDDLIVIAVRPDARDVVLEVADSGPGVDPAESELVFERFWHTTAPNGSVGSGLGLSMVRAVAAAHGGSAEVSRGREGGARFVIRLPRQSAAAAGTVPRPQAMSAAEVEACRSVVEPPG
jgi:signal transduction histidine kinase